MGISMKKSKPRTSKRKDKGKDIKKTKTGTKTKSETKKNLERALPVMGISMKRFKTKIERRQRQKQR